MHLNRAACRITSYNVCYTKLLRDLGLLVTNLRELMEHSLPASLRLELEIAPDLRPAWMDANQLENSRNNFV